MRATTQRNRRRHPRRRWHRRIRDRSRHRDGRCGRRASNSPHTGRVAGGRMRHDTTERLRGKRIESPFNDDGILCAAWPVEGEYWNDANVGWACVTPNGHQFRLSDHTVTEHEDQTITVEPLIEIGGGRWYLQ